MLGALWTTYDFSRLPSFGVPNEGMMQTTEVQREATVHSQGAEDIVTFRIITIAWVPLALIQMSWETLFFRGL